MTEPTRICVLISGTGSNLQALIDALRSSHRIPAEIVMVFSDRRKAPGLDKAKDAGISTQSHSWLPYKDRPDKDAARDEYDKELATRVLASQAQLVACLGYMRILRPVFLQRLRDANVEIINLHPALPGEHPGTNAIKAAHDDWLKGLKTRTGVMIHRVIEEVDAGEVVVKREIPFKSPEDDNFAAFEQKFHLVEHDLVVEGVQKVVAEIRGDPA